MRPSSGVASPVVYDSFLELSHMCVFFLTWASGMYTASSIGKRRDRIHATAVGRSDVGISIEEGGGRPPRAYQGLLFVVRKKPRSLQSRDYTPLGSK